MKQVSLQGVEKLIMKRKAVTLQVKKRTSRKEKRGWEHEPEGGVGTKFHDALQTALGSTGNWFTLYKYKTLKWI